jgi:hypothetical protein
MLHAYVQIFDVIGGKSFGWELNMTLPIFQPSQKYLSFLIKSSSISHDTAIGQKILQKQEQIKEIPWNPLKMIFNLQITEVLCSNMEVPHCCI